VTEKFAKQERAFLAIITVNFLVKINN